MFRQRLSSLRALPLVPAGLLVAGLLGVVWMAVFASGGTRTAWPHLFYLPVVAAVIPLGRRGGITAGVVATILCGPLMPLDVAAGVAQSPDNWLVRGLFFVIVGGLAGTAVRAATTELEHGLTAHLTAELDRAIPQGDGLADVAVLREAIDQQQFQMVFQPIYDLDVGRLLAVEALARFPALTPIQSPATWFAQAAEVGLGVDLELATAQAALEQTGDLPGHIALTLNVSPCAVADPRFDVLLEQHPGRHLVVELTEHAAVDDYTGLHTCLAQLRARGVRIAVDDAGAGFASLQHIVRLGPDIIKLDISLTQHVRDDPVRRALAAALVQFADQTGTELVAEGIETPADLATWQQLGAHAAQGYLLGHPTAAPISLDPCPGLTRRHARRYTPARLMEVSR